MNKKQFLAKLEENLEILTNTTRTKELLKYEKKIDSEIQKNISEEKAVEKLGDPSVIANKILIEHGINVDYLDKNNSSNGYLSSFFEAIDNFVSKMSKKNSKEITRLILELLTIFLVIAVLKIPFIFLKDLITMLLDMMQLTVSGFISVLISIGIEFVYILIAVTMFISIFKKRFGNITKA